MNYPAILYEEKKFSQIINHAIKCLENEIEITKQDAIAIIKTLLRYEYDEAALLFFEKYKKIKGIETPTIRTRINEIIAKFSKLNHKAVYESNNLRTTSELHLLNLSTQRNKKYNIKSPANLLLVIDSLGPGGAERQFVTLLNHLSINPPEEVGTVYGLVLTNNKVNSEFYLEQVLPCAKKNLITTSKEETAEQETLNEEDIDFGNKGKKLAIRKIRNAIKQYKIDAAIGFLEETSINTCIAALYEDIIGITRFGSLPNIIGREIDDDLNIKYNIRLKLLSAIDSPNIIWGANSQRCLNKYLLHSCYNQKLYAKRTIVIPNIVKPEKSHEFIDKQFDELSGKIKVISIMRLSQEKRPNLFTQIATRYKENPNVHFVLIGDGPMHSFVEEAQQAGAPIYWVKNTDKIDYYLTNSDIYLMTSIIEGSPNAVIESSQCGLPAITADIGGVSETYTHLQDAIFVNEIMCIESYISAINTLITNKSLRYEIASNASARIKKRHGGYSTNAAIGISLQHY